MIYDDHTSSAMNYYEELGIGKEATEQEIRKAHRRLVKLMHPDAQPDQSLKMLAETQMRRLNSIVSTLLDPDQRRSYDEQLAAAHGPFRQGFSERLAWRGIPWWFASAGLAVVLALAAVYVWADHLGNSLSTKANRPAYSIPAADNRLGVAPPANGSADPNNSKPLGASYTPPADGSQPPPSVSDQSKVSEPPHSSGSISATVVTDPPVVAQTPVPHPPEKQLVPAKPEQKSQSVVIVADHPAPPVSKPSTSQPPLVADSKKPAQQVLPKTPELHISDKKAVVAHNDTPPKSAVPLKPVTAKPVVAKPAETKSIDIPAPKKIFTLPSGSLIARVMPSGKAGKSQLPAPPRIAMQSNRDYYSSALPGSALPAAAPPVPSVVSSGASLINPRDPLEGEWVYAPKEPERRRAGFYPPEFIDLKLFGSGDPGNLKGQYSAKYVVTDRPVSPEVSFELASAAKGSRKFVWQSNNGAKGTLNIDAIDDRTIRVDWHTTTAVHGPALTSGTATLVRRQ